MGIGRDRLGGDEPAALMRQDIIDQEAQYLTRGHIPCDRRDPDDVVRVSMLTGTGDTPERAGVHSNQDGSASFDGVCQILERIATLQVGW